MTTPTQVTPTTTPTTVPAAPPVPASSGGGTRDAVRGADYNTGAAMVAPPPAGYSVAGKGAYGPAAGSSFFDPSKQTEWGRVSGTGAGWGNRKGDVDQKNEKTGAMDPAKNKSVDMKAITGIPEPELDKLKSTHKKEVGGRFGTYAGYDVASGEASGMEPGFKAGGKAGKDQSASVTGPYYQAGGTAKAYAGIKGEAKNDYGSLSGKAEGYGKAYYGVSGKTSLGASRDAKTGKMTYGASAEGALGAGVEVGVTGKADAKTAGLKMAGVDTPLDAGIGVGGTARAYAKAGIGGGAYLNNEKVGVTGSAGIGAVAEAKADIHGNIGPVGAKYEMGVLAGIGAGIEGAILYEGGKLTIGGRAYAAMGYGASAGLSVTIDVKQSYQMAAAILKKAADLGIKGAKAAYKAADADADGKLTLNDAATHASNAMDKGAKKFERGVDGAIAFLDGDGDGKFDFKKDMGARASQAKDAVVGAGKRVLKAGGEVVDGAKKAVSKAADRAHKAADMDGDGKLSVKDVGAGVEKAKDWAAQKVDEGVAWASQKKDEALAWGEAKIDQAHKAADAAHKFMDRTGDGKLGLDDVRKGAGEVYDAGKKTVTDGAAKASKAVKDAGAWAVEKGGAAVDWAKEKGGQAAEWASKKKDEVVAGAKDLGNKAHAAADRDGDGKLGLGDVKAGAAQAKQAVVDAAKAVDKKLSDGYDAAKKTVESGLKAAHDAADLNNDGKVDSEDAKIAAAKAKAAALAAAERARQKAAAAYKAAQDAKAKLEAKAAAAIEAAKKAADRDGDGKLGLGDVKAGASQAYAAASAKATEVKTAVVAGAKAAYKSASEGVSRAAETLSSGYNAASERVGAAWGRFSTFVRGG
ncbi:MAG: hypothetical protein IT385_25540 [Deltaproteobacteria bacterium]|nr:hypothetical protein [Deltaproteobacteria bacterium]